MQIMMAQIAFSLQLTTTEFHAFVAYESFSAVFTLRDYAK